MSCSFHAVPSASFDEVAFVGLGSQGTMGIYRWDGTLAVVADTNTIVPPGGLSERLLCYRLFAELLHSQVRRIRNRSENAESSAAY